MTRHEWGWLLAHPGITLLMVVARGMLRRVEREGVRP